MQTTFVVPGMHCNSCVSLIKDVSGDFPSIRKVDINLETKRVVVDHANNFDKDLWTKEVESLGETYKVQQA